MRNLNYEISKIYECVFRTTILLNESLMKKAFLLQYVHDMNYGKFSSYFHQFYSFIFHDHTSVKSMIEYTDSLNFQLFLINIFPPI